MMLLYSKVRKVEAEFYGMDVMSDFLNIAQERGYRSVVERDIRNLPHPFEDGFFDVVILSHILEHLERPDEVIGEVRRMIKKNGVVIIGVPIGLLPGILWRQYITPLYSPHKRKEEALKRFGHVNFFTLPAMKKLLKQHGFVTETARGDYFIRARGFFLENYKWWFDFNQFYGKLFPGTLGHVTLKARASNSIAPTATHPVTLSGKPGQPGNG